jgi:hypothetical protein
MLKSKAVKQKETESLSALIEKRYKWLNNDANKKRRTYSAVLKDTKEMEQNLKDLKE